MKQGFHITGGIILGLGPTGRTHLFTGPYSDIILFSGGSLYWSTKHP